MIPLDTELWIDKSRWNVLEPSLLVPYVKGVISKCSQGDYFPDPTFVGDQTLLPNYNLKRACYHWDDPLDSVSPTTQVNKILQIISPYLDAQEFIAVDVEQWWADWAKWNEWRKGYIPKSDVPMLSKAQISDSAHNICEQLKTKTGKKIVVYTRAWFVKEYAPDMLNWIGDYNSWYAQWPYNSGYVEDTWDEFLQAHLPSTQAPAFPTGYSDNKWVAWQFSGEKFYLPGCSGSSDLNFVKTSFLDDTTPPPAPVVDRAVLRAGLNIRTFPWGQDWGNTDKTVTLEIEKEVEDEHGQLWYKFPAYVASWLVNKV